LVGVPALAGKAGTPTWQLTVDVKLQKTPLARLTMTTRAKKPSSEPNPLGAPAQEASSPVLEVNPASESSSAANRLDALAEEFVERYRRGERPAVSEYTECYPDLADEIRELFPALVMLQDVQPEPNPATGSFETRLRAPDSPLERVGDYRILR